MSTSPTLLDASIQDDGKAVDGLTIACRPHQRSLGLSLKGDFGGSLTNVDAPPK